jgi:hypothetical protein
MHSFVVACSRFLQAKRELTLGSNKATLKFCPEPPALHLTARLNSNVHASHEDTNGFAASRVELLTRTPW